MDLTKIFLLKISSDKMTAWVQVNKGYLDSLYSEYSIDEVKQSLSTFNLENWLKEQKIVYGINQENCLNLINNIDFVDEQVEVAHGKRPVHGKDGYVEFLVNYKMTLSIEQKGQIDFKEVMKIPKVEVGDKLARIHKPTDGINGIDIYGNEIKAKRGKEARIKVGENVKLIEDEDIIYSTGNGQVSVTGNKINVLPVFEVNQDLDLSIGNIDFNGSVIIRGDVPNGFTVKARGDIQVYGLVEAASLEAGGSILINEGFSGLGKGKLIAGLDIHIGNVNQGILEAGRNVLVDKSILHSQVIAKDTVYCKSGNIIGGVVSAGKKIYGQNIGNRLSTKTYLYLGENKKVLEEKKRINNEMIEIANQIKKLELIGENLLKIKQNRPLTNNEEMTLKRQQQSLNQYIHQLNELKDSLRQYEPVNDHLTSDEKLVVFVHNVIYPNVTIVSGKYSQPFQTEYKHIKVSFSGSDFHIEPL
mgnify:CR=1 FL=1